MNAQTALNLYARAEDDPFSQNIYARANARYILFGVDEPRSNFPKTLETNLDNGSDNLGFTYLSIGCTLFEQKSDQLEIMISSLEKGAEFIEYRHLPTQNRNKESHYYLLISALAYYSAGQYSKAFIIIKESEGYQTELSLLCSYFLKKDYANVHELLNKILLDDHFIDPQQSEIFLTERQHIFIFARSIANLMDYLYTGNESNLSATLEIQDDLLELLEIDHEPSLWWIVRLFKIISFGFHKSSLYNNILPIAGVSRKKTRITKNYINNLIFGKKSVVELFTSQRDALPLVFQEKGAVISLPTSSGKTQIASIAILQCLIDNPSSKVLYLAPYRSLAFEVETTLKEVFEPINYEVSQLYGTGQFSTIDKHIISNANILIATPEKAKVILRINPEMAELIKLIIIDEGHLLDDSKRNVTNELFVEELKVYINRNEGKIILLSAVLPNTDDIAKWVCNDEKLSIQKKERMARQRHGVLHFVQKKNTVHLEWFGEEESSNPNFVKPILPTGRATKIQPAEKAEAIAHTAIKLSSNGKSLLLFTARATSVLKYARCLKNALKLEGQLESKHIWTSKRVWEEFKILCEEYESDENKKLVEYAEYGILCHYGGLNRDIRTALEKLMKNSNPRIIVATMTLGQGVNLGVSTVILADTKFFNIKTKEWKALSTNEIWNIIGRAGRAFQDIEGKTLFAIESKPELKIVKEYLNQPPANAYSGLLQRIQHIIQIAAECKINFDTLLELITSNNLSDFHRRKYIATNENVKKDFEDTFDWIDDSLLSLNILSEEDPNGLDDILRKTLAYIQAKNYPDIAQNDVFLFLKARNKALTNIIVPDKNQWKSLISSSLPLASALNLNLIFHKIVELGEQFLSSKKTISNKLSLLKEIEGIINEFPSSSFKPKLNDQGERSYSDDLINEARTAWISGKSLTNVSDIKKIIKICNDYFAFTITWVLGAIANKCKSEDREDLAEVYEDLALCCEVGLPDSTIAKIYLSGIRSRTASMEINKISNSLLFDVDLSLSDVKRMLLDEIEDLKSNATNPLTKAWLEIYVINNNENTQKHIHSFPDFTLDIDNKINANKFYVKSMHNNHFFLSSPDYTEIIPVISTTDFPFEKLVNRVDCHFQFQNKIWKFKSSFHN